MKKIAIIVCALFTAFSASAYYNSYDEDISGFTIFLMIVAFIGSLIIFIRWWKMTTNIETIRKILTRSNPSPQLTYLVAIGENEQAQKRALAMLVDELYPIYILSKNHSKAADMDQVINSLLPKMQRLGIEVPEYVTSGEKFIDYMNNLTGKKVKYKDEEPNETDHTVTPKMPR